MTSLNNNNSFHCLNDTSSPDVRNATSAQGTTNKIAYATSSESEQQSITNPLKTAPLQHSGKSVYKSNGRRRTLAPIRFRSKNNCSSMSSTSSSNDSHHPSKSRFEYGSDRTSDDTESNKKAKIGCETKITQDAFADIKHMEYQQSSENGENIPPTETSFSTPTEMKDIVVNHATTLSSLSNRTTESQSKTSHDRCSIDIDDDANNGIKILSATTNYHQKKVNNLNKQSTSHSPSSSTHSSSETSGYKTETEDVKLNTDNGLRRSKRIRNREQRETESQESASSNETKLIKGSKNKMECASLPPTIQRSDCPFENERQPTLSTNEKSVDMKSMSRTLEHNLSISMSNQCLIQSSSNKSIVLDESADVCDMKKIPSTVLNKGGRRRSIRLSKRTLGVDTGDRLKKPTYDVSKDASNGLLSCDTSDSTKKSELHLEIDDDIPHCAEDEVKQNTTRRRRSMRSTKGIVPERFRDQKIPSSQHDIKPKEFLPGGNVGSKEINADRTNTTEPIRKSSLHQILDESIKVQSNHVGNKSIVKKRRRRSNLGLHAGGLISVQDIERIEKEAIARKKRRDFQNQSVNENSTIAIKCIRHIPSPTSNATGAGLSSNLNQNLTNEGNVATDNQCEIKEDSRKKNQYIPKAEEISLKVKTFLQSSDINSKVRSNLSLLMHCWPFLHFKNSLSSSNFKAMYVS